MTKPILNRVLARTLQLAKDNAPMILSVLGSVGVVGTAVSSSKAAIKAVALVEEMEPGKEKVVALAKCYAPTALIGTATVGCILGAAVLNKKAQATLLGAYAMLDSYHKSYRQNLIDIHGEAADKEIRTRMQGHWSDVAPAPSDEPDMKMKFYDRETDSYFYRYEREIVYAEMHFNRNFVLRGDANLNEFREFLGLEAIPDGEDLGWSVVDEFYWVDFTHELIGQDENGRDIYEIVADFPARRGYTEYWDCD